MSTFYCPICRNARVARHGHHCPNCVEYVVEGKLAEAFDRWVHLGNHADTCCRGLQYRFGSDIEPSAREEGHLYFHGLGWDGTHEGTWVEYGVAFYADHARTYFIRDLGDVSDSEEYGDRLDYADPDFWQKLNVQLDGAPKAAYDAGLLTCNLCGYNHYLKCRCTEIFGDAKEVSNG